MDDYLRDRYKKVDGGDLVSRPRPSSGRYSPPARRQRQPARPMFPVNSRDSSQTKPMFPIKPESLGAESITESAPRAARDYNQTATKHRKQSKRRVGLFKILSVLLVLGLAAGGAYYYMAYAKVAAPLPQKLVESAGFPIYYPTKIPAGYKYQTGTAYTQKGLFVYKIANGSNGVVVSEQAKPTTYFNISALPNFKTIDVGDGSAAIGTSGGVLTAVYVSQTTLVNITAVNAISRGEMIAIAQNLSPVKK